MPPNEKRKVITPSLPLSNCLYSDSETNAMWHLKWYANQWKLVRPMRHWHWHWSCKLKVALRYFFLHKSANELLETKVPFSRGKMKGSKWKATAATVNCPRVIHVHEMPGVTPATKIWTHIQRDNQVEASFSFSILIILLTHRTLYLSLRRGELSRDFSS